MTNEITRFEFNQQEVDFEQTNEKLMVNATQMAKIFGKYPKDFLVLDGTKNFIKSALKKENSPNINVIYEDDLVKSNQKSGTWMHRILALKFAAWLDPDFELWVYSTIDDLLFGRYRILEESLKRSALRKNRIDQIRQELNDDERFKELERLELEERQASYSRSKENKNQLDLFRTIEV